MDIIFKKFADLVFFFMISVNFAEIFYICCMYWS